MSPLLDGQSRPHVLVGGRGWGSESGQACGSSSLCGLLRSPAGSETSPWGHVLIFPGRGSSIHAARLGGVWPRQPHAHHLHLLLGPEAQPCGDPAPASLLPALTLNPWTVGCSVDIPMHQGSCLALGFEKRHSTRAPERLLVREWSQGGRRREHRRPAGQGRTEDGEQGRDGGW